MRKRMGRISLPTPAMTRSPRGSREEGGNDRQGGRDERSEGSTEVVERGGKKNDGGG